MMPLPIDAQWGGTLLWSRQVFRPSVSLCMALWQTISTGPIMRRNFPAHNSKNTQDTHNTHITQSQSILSSHQLKIAHPLSRIAHLSLMSFVDIQRVLSPALSNSTLTLRSSAASSQLTTMMTRCQTPRKSRSALHICPHEDVRSCIKSQTLNTEFLEQVDSSVALLTFGTVRPIVELTNAYTFSVRWKGFVKHEYAEMYTYQVNLPWCPKSETIW